MRTPKQSRPKALQRAALRPRRSVQAIQLAFCCGAASALPATASCVLDGATISSVVSFADSCEIGGTLKVTASGFLTTSGAITNRGLISSAGRINSQGTLSNLGELLVEPGGAVSINSSGNLNGTTLTGGNWRVVADTGKASLSVGQGAITTNAAAIELSGIDSRFDQLDSLTNNQGLLIISHGRQFTLASLTNSGTLTVASTGTLTLGKSGNLVNETLTGGIWKVLASSAQTDTTLVVGTGRISVNNAEILLAGAGARFQQLDGLRTNNGTLAITGGRDFTSLDLTNNGTLTVSSGSSVTIAKSANIAGTTLTKGSWVVSGAGAAAGRLSVGTDAITTNDANVLLDGPDAHFDQLTGLTRNRGSLDIAGGQRFTAGELINTGSLFVHSNSNLHGMIGANKLLVGLTQQAGSLRVDGVVEMGRVEISRGVLTGSGVVRSSDHITVGSGAVVQPGAVIGALTLDGDVSFGGLLEIELFSAASFDTLRVSGDLDFQAGSKVRLLLDFVPVAPSYSFQFLLAGSVLGQPTSYEVVGNTLGYSQQLNCVGHGCRFELLAAAVPEPATYAMLLAGLGLLGCGVRRRKQLPSDRAA